jgi:hypothetical protein
MGAFICCRARRFGASETVWRKGDRADNDGAAPGLAVTKAFSLSEGQTPMGRRATICVVAPQRLAGRGGCDVSQSWFRLVRAPSGSRVMRRVSGGRARVAIGSSLLVERGERTWASV